MGATLLPDELVVNEHRAFNTIVDWLSHWVDVNDTNALKVYGANPITIMPTRLNMSDFRTKENLESFIVWLRKSQAHVRYIVSHPELMSPLYHSVAEQVVIKHAGIQTTWYRSNVDWLMFKKSAITRVLDGIAEYKSLENSRSSLWVFKNEKLNTGYLDDPNAPLILRSAWMSRRDALMGVSARYSDLRVTDYSDDDVTKLVLFSDYGEDIPLQHWSTVERVLEAYNTQPNAPTLLRNRNQVLERQAMHASRNDQVSKHMREQRFSAFWQKMKETQRSVRPNIEVAQAQWDTIPLQPAGTSASRTWGIEVEVVDAGRTNRPMGWRDVYDGSLPEADGSCGCDCDYCYDDNHCQDTDNSCYYDTSSESREFVSPVLQDFNSNGLREICNDLPDDDGWTEPGVHVHVGASDLTVADISRLLFAYAAVAPIIQPLYYRKVYNYCNEMSFTNVQWWNRAVKEQARVSPLVPTNPRDICTGQPDSRYSDVNLHALEKHGTIEFRSMGPRYNYAHLVRWAWFCREMVNLSRLNLDQRIWLSCRSVADVIGVLRKYGKEMPSTVEFDNINSDDLELVEQ
jgi:hypothetical protein